MDRSSSTTYASEAERLVAQLLTDGLGDDVRTWSNLRVTNRAKDHEIDFVVAIPGAGVVCLEVKGGQVTYDGMHWRQTGRNGKSKRIDPVGQARNGKYALRGYVESDPRWGSRQRIRWAHAVVFPFTALAENFAVPECPREIAFGRDDLDRLVGSLGAIARSQETQNPPPSEDDVALVADIVRGRGLPQADVIGIAAERAAMADRLTEQQRLILEVSKLIRRMEIRGGAGSGKTWLAMEQARRLQRDGERVALVCYSRGLAAYFQRVTSAWPRRERPSYVGTFHGLGIDEWGAEETDLGDDDSPYWEEQLPAQMVELAGSLPPNKRYDAVVVDEAQDFADAWWPAVVAALKDPDDGRLTIMSDEGQRVFSRFGGMPECQAVLTLEANLRNTRQIADTFQSLAMTRMRNRGGDGPAVRFVECPTADAIGRADDEVDRLLDEGWRPQDVALLTVGSRHPEQSARQAEGHDEYWASFWDEDQVFYGHVLGFKGLERSVIVLALNQSNPRERSKERVYVGLSRARDCLVVVGDPGYVDEVGGPQLTRRLRG